MSFGHAGTIVEGEEDSATAEDRPARGRRDPGGRADRRDPGRGQGEAWGGVMAERAAGVFIDVEVDDAVASDAEIAKKLEEVCPVDIFAVTGEGVEIVAREPRRVRALRALPRGGARRHGRVKKLYDGTELRR